MADRAGFATNFLITGAILVVGIFCFLFMLGRIEQIKAPYTGVSETAKTTGTPAA